MTTSPVMSITDELLAELEAIQHDASDVTRDPDSQEYLGSLATRLLAHIADLKQQLVAAGVTAENCEVFRRDAERYQWLRMQDWFSGDLCVLRDPKKVLTGPSGLGADCPSRDRLDDAIDATRQS